jgi:hypothetical protein
MTQSGIRMGNPRHFCETPARQPRERPHRATPSTRSTEAGPGLPIKREQQVQPKPSLRRVAIRVAYTEECCRSSSLRAPPSDCIVVLRSLLLRSLRVVIRRRQQIFDCKTIIYHRLHSQPLCYYCPRCLQSLPSAHPVIKETDYWGPTLSSPA